jgi:hypothetical protein
MRLCVARNNAVPSSSAVMEFEESKKNLLLLDHCYVYRKVETY